MLSELADFVGLDAGTATADRVLDALCDCDTLLFLDGIERCLRCYQRPMAVGDIDAVRIQENQQWNSHDLSFVSEDALRFFVQLTQLNGCRTICTSRVVPAEYYASGGHLRSGIVVHLVDALTANEAATLLSHVGLQVEGKVAMAVASALGGHPLALQLLARQARHSVQARRNLGTWLAAEGYSDTAGQGPKAIRARLFARSIAVLSMEARMILSVVGALGGSLDVPSLFEILPSRIEEERFFEVVEEVKASGLAVETSAGELACHALTAEAALDQIDSNQIAALSKEIDKSLRGRYTAINSGYGISSYYDWAVRGEISDRAEVMALCRALTRLGKYEEAAELYISDLDMPIRLLLGANFETAELLEGLVTGLATIGSEKSTSQLPGLQVRLAYHLLMSGRPERAKASLTAADGSLESADEILMSIEVMLHLGDYDKAAKSATAFLHDLREQLFYLNGYDEEDFGLGFNIFSYEGEQMRWFMRSNGMAAAFCELAVVLVRILLAGGRPGEAARLLVYAIGVQQAIHDQCDGCLGLLVRSSAEVLADWDLAVAVETQAIGEAMQKENGKALQGLASDVLVLTAGAREGLATERLVQLRTLLEDSGFVLYRLLAQTVTSITSDVAEKALIELREMGAVYLRSQADKIPCWSIDEEMTARCVGWLIQQPRDNREDRRSFHLANKNDGRERSLITVRKKLRAISGEVSLGRDLLPRVSRKVFCAGH